MRFRAFVLECKLLFIVVQHVTESSIQGAVKENKFPAVIRARKTLSAISERQISMTARLDIFYFTARLDSTYFRNFVLYSQKEISPERFMVNDDSQRITHLLINWSNGDEFALEQLMPLVYEELRQMARRYMRNQRSGHTFQTTELIHEAYLKLASGEDKQWQNRAHFFGVAATAMRHILVDYARSKQAEKRGGQAEKITLEDNMIVSAERPEEIVRLDEALKRFALIDERKARVVEMKFFAGLNIEEIAEVLKISPETVKRDWRFSRTWLYRELSNTA